MRMKKLLTFLTLLTLSIGVTWAATVTKTITFNSAFSPTLSTSSHTDVITHTVEGLSIAEVDVYKTSSYNYMMFKQNSGFLYNLEDLGTIKSVSVTYTSGTSNTGQVGVYFGNSVQSTYNTSSNNLINQGGTQTWTNSTTGNGYFQVSSSNKNVQITTIVITYEDGGSTPEPTTYALTMPTGLTGGTVTSNYSGDLTKIASGTSITVTATPATGYTLEYMKANGVNVDNPYTFAIAENTTITAAFAALQTYAISVTNGTANPTTAYEGQTVTLTPTIPDGKVVDWNNTTVSPSTLEINHSDYTFTMPGEAVTVNFAFKDAPNESTATLTNANIVAAGTGQDGYRDWTLTDENGKTWNAYAIKKAHSNATSSYHFLQIKKSTNTESSFIQVPEYGTKITKLEMTVSNASQPMTGGGNSATLFFSSSNSTSSTGTGIASGTGSSKVTIDCSNLDLNTGYITSSGAVRIWDVKVFYEDDNPVQSNDLYIVGQVNGNDEDPIDTSEGVELNYNQTNDIYTIDFYCKGMSDGYSYFLFAKSLPFSWDNTSNLYGSGADNSYWPISGLSGESAFDEEIPLYEGSKNVYRLPAGLYTVTVDLDYTGHEYTTKSVKVTKRDVTMTISPSSAYFAETQNVTMASNLTEIGGKIYYTTNGNDPRDQYSGRQEYTGQLTISETTTFKAVAYVGNLYSDVVEKTYTKTPAAPVITPASCTFSEPFQVTITAEEGATIYYTTDGSNPTDQSTQYTGPFTVSTTTTVKAKAYVNGVYGATATETYTYSNVQPGTGDFTLVKSANDIVAGREYIIINSDRNAAASTVSGTKFSVTDDFTLSNNNETASAGSAVKVFTLEATGNDLFYLKDVDGTYYTPSSSSTDIDSDKNAIYIAYDGGYVLIKNSSSASRSIAYNHQANTHVFGSYSNPTPTGNQRPIYLYYRETNSVQPPVFSPIAGIYNVDIDVTISCATDGATIYYTTDGTEPSATNGTEYTGEIIVSESTTFKAIAVKGENSSSVVTAAYTIQKSTDIATVTLTYSEPFTQGIGDFTINNVSGFSPVWSLDGNYGVKGTSYSNGTNYAAVSRLVSPIIDMTGSVQPELSFSHQINKYFTDPTTQCQVFIRETSNGTSGTWVQIPITFSDPVAAGGWTNDVVDIDLTDINGVSYADKKVQISFLYTNPTAGTGAGTWEIQNFVVADNSEYRMVNNIAEFLALENGTKAKFKNPVTVLYDYAQYSSNSYHEYIWVKDESGYMQFYLKPTLNSSTESNLSAKAAYYENGDIIPAGFVVVKNYYENGKYVQAYSTEALDAGFEPATQKGLADPDHYEFSTLNALTLSDADIAANCNRYITVEKVKIASKSSKNFTFANENGTVNACVGYNKYNGDGSLLKDGTTSADVTVPAVSNTYYNVKGIIQIWQGGWEFMPIEFTEWKADEVTLRKLCADGVVNNEYKISNNLLGVYASADGTKLWVKDDNGQSISPDAPDATYKDNFPINAEGNTRLDQALYDQSNWCEIQLAEGEDNANDFVGKIIKGGSIDGKFTNKTNPTMTGVTLTNDNIYSDGSYEPNYYIPCNFYGNQSCQTSQHGQPGHGDYFFMTPKPQEYAMVVWAIWDSANEQFVVNENPQYNSHGFQGSFKVDLSLNQNPNIALHDGMNDNFAYNFSAIIRVNSSKAGSDFMVYPLNLSAATDPATAIESVVAGNGEVKSVKFYNVAGIESATPFQGVNIVVTEYTDGSRTTTKMLRK